MGRKKKELVFRHCLDLTDEQKQELTVCKKDENCFSFCGLITLCSVVDVYDGDTIKIKFYHNNELIQVDARLYGIDTPELKPKRAGRTEESIEEEKREARRSALRLCNLCAVMPYLAVRFLKKEKFGREMIVLYRNQDRITEDWMENSINQQMIDEGYAVKYFGDKKVSFDEKQKSSE
jgi:endonuclease YncB( thermonuclease family)